MSIILNYCPCTLIVVYQLKAVRNVPVRRKRADVPKGSSECLLAAINFDSFPHVARSKVYAKKIPEDFAKYVFLFMVHAELKT